VQHVKLNATNRKNPKVATWTHCTYRQLNKYTVQRRLGFYGILSTLIAAIYNFMSDIKEQKM